MHGANLTPAKMKFCITSLILLSSLAAGNVNEEALPSGCMNVRNDVGRCQDACASFVKGYGFPEPQQTTTKIVHDDAEFYQTWLMPSMCNQMLTTSVFATETIDIHATATKTTTNYSTKTRPWTDRSTFPPFPTACRGSGSDPSHEEEWEQAFRSACSCDGWTAKTVTTFMPGTTVREPTDAMGARELSTKLTHSRGPLQTKQAISQFPLDARDGGTCNDECAKQMKLTKSSYTWLLDHPGYKSYESFCNNFIITTVMPVAAITTGRPITTKATYNATTTFVPSWFPNWQGWDELESCEYRKAKDSLEFDVDKMRKALSSACSCAGVTPTITTATKPIALQTPASRLQVDFDGLFKLRAHFQDSNNASWLVCEPDFGSDQNNDRYCSFDDHELQATYYQLKIMSMSIAEWSDNSLPAAVFGKLMARIPGGNIASSDDPEMVLFGDMEGIGPNSVSFFVEKEVKEKEGSRYVLKADGGHGDPEIPNLEFVSCQDKICLATRQWALDFARGDLSEYSKSTLQDYRLLALEVVPVTEALHGPRPGEIH